MKFVKLTCNYYRDPAIAADLSDAGEVAFTRGIAYCGDAETGGFIPAAILPSLMRRYTPARGKKVAAEMVLSQLWIEVPGGWQIRTWDRQQDELERLLSRRRNDAERQQRHRSKQTFSPPMSRDIARDASRDSHVMPFACAPSQELELEVELNQPLITLVCRRLSGDARKATTTDEERAELWAMWAEVAGPGVDLEADLRSWLIRNAETDLHDPAGALIGWLRKGAERARSAAPLGCQACAGGWLPDDVATGRPVPCPTCRPHLRAVAS